MEGNEFSFKYVSKLTIKYTKTNTKKGSSYINLSEWLKCKNATVSPKSIDHRCCWYPFALTQHYEEITNHPQQVSNIKPFISFYY